MLTLRLFAFIAMVVGADRGAQYLLRREAYRKLRLRLLADILHDQSRALAGQQVERGLEVARRVADHGGGILAHHLLVVFEGLDADHVLVEGVGNDQVALFIDHGGHLAHRSQGDGTHGVGHRYRLAKRGIVVAGQIRYLYLFRQR